MNVQKRYILKCILFLALISAFVLSSTAQSFDDIKNKIKMHQLDNGMKFIVLERHEAPVVSFHVYADVGSANESYGITGISHLLEHMAFKGTKTVGTKDFKEEIKILEKMDAVYNQLKKEKSKINPDEEKI
ncbi:MAG: M16 family metallopeptidase [Candidatus Aminicenantaceae bacterium]